MVATLTDRIAAVQEQIAQAAQRVGRSAESVTLIAVSKTHAPDVIAAAYDAGLRHFGENRSDELAAKAAALTGLPDLRWHFIGTLQSRQTQAVADHADVFHAVDRLKIARRLSRQLEEAGRTLPVFVEVNVSGEGSKSGFSAERWEDDADQRAALHDVCATIADLPRIELRGLMTMAPWDAPEATLRSVFRRTRALADWLRQAVPQGDWSALSMGMSDDFTLAIEEGATHVRVGRAIFGERVY